MRNLIRLMFVWSVALAFVASGAAWCHCMAAQQPIPAAVQVQDHGTHDHASHGSVAHDHGSHHHAAADQMADDNGQPASNNHDCGKCCSICTVSGAMPPSPAVVVFEVSAVAFILQTDATIGSATSVDPGIPKLIV
jgi:hypothetical protein